MTDGLSQLDMFGAGQTASGFVSSCGDDAQSLEAVAAVSEIGEGYAGDEDFDDEEFDEDDDDEVAGEATRGKPSRENAIHNEATLLEALVKRVAIDAADPDLMPTLLSRLREFEPAATITLATLERLGVRGLIACLLASEDASAFGYYHLAEYAKMEHRTPVDHLFTMAMDVIACPTCGVLETHHDTPRRSRESDERERPFPCDPVAYAAEREAEIARTKVRYAVGARIGGYAGFAWEDPERYVVTRSTLSRKAPSWWKGSMSVNWDRPLPWYGSAALAPRYQGPHFETDPEKVWFEFNAVNAVRADALLSITPRANGCPRAK